MEKYNYLEAITDDVIEAIGYYSLEKFESLEEFEEFLNEELWAMDSVTGNGSGSYYCNAWGAEEAICHNLDLVAEAYDEFGGAPDLLSPEACDVTVRCYLLGQAISEALAMVETPWDEQ